MKKRGKYLVGACPFCGDASAFHVNPANSRFYCFACSEKGEEVDLTASKEEAGA